MAVIFRKIRSAIRHLKQYEKKASWGSENPDKQFFVLRREESRVGIMSDVTVFLGQLKYMERRYPNAIPVIDLKYYPQTVASGDENAWELFFEQPNKNGWTLERIQNSRNILTSTIESSPNIYFPHSNDATWSRLHKLGYDKIYDKYISLRLEIVQEYQTAWREISAGIAGPIIGVLARGTDYDTQRLAGHPNQPSVEQIMEKVDAMMASGAYSHLFLATESEQVEALFREHYGNQLRTFQTMYVEYKGGFFAENIPAELRTQVTHQYLRNMYAIARCDAFVGAKTSAAFYILLENKNRFREVVFLDNGYYA